ncbi:hypothetical protein E1A91_D04G141600v1 [Gossypium mustelinum]|uniref:Uncharacterized protein n=1 Tax=Gossypium mustelinum TaxID=34275 RepID=A0A5D2VED5_GOSMU|nr:hypothetical protein E1A91_D04G141600v1 [Gossypium mustelinum]
MKRAHFPYSPDRSWHLAVTVISFISLSFLLALTFIQGNSSSFETQPKFSFSDRAYGGLPELSRFAYLISGTKGDGPRVKQLLQAVYHPRNYDVLHLDLEASDSERMELAKYVKSERVVGEFENVIVIGNADLVTYKEALDWDWFVNLSASDYPLMSQDDIVHIFSFLHRDLSFVEHTSSIGWKEYPGARPIIIDPGLYHAKKSGVFWAKEKRSFLLLSNYQNTTVNHDLHYIRWDNPPKQHPMTLTLKHFDDMVQSGTPFPPKFAKDDLVLDKIDKELLR